MRAGALQHDVRSGVAAGMNDCTREEQKGPREGTPLSGDGLYLHGKLLFTAAEAIVFQLLTLEDLGQAFFSNHSMSRIIRRYFATCRPILNEKHFPVCLDDRNTLFLVCLASKASLKQLHVGLFPSISVDEKKQRVFALRWLARALISGRQTLQSFRWMSRPGLNMPLLHSFSQCTAVTNVNLCGIRVDEASDILSDGRCDEFTKNWLQRAHLPELRALTLNVTERKGDGDDDDKHVRTNAPLFGPVTTAVASDVLFARSGFYSLESLELIHVHFDMVIGLSALTRLRKLRLDITDPDPEQQRLCVAYDKLSPVLATLRNLVELAIGFRVVYKPSLHQSEGWRVESTVESVDAHGWQLPHVNVLTLNGTNSDDNLIELAIVPKVYAPALTALNLHTCHARGVLAIARHATDLNTLMWECDSVTGVCDVDDEEDRLSACAWRDILADFPWPRMLTCRLPIRGAVNATTLNCILQRASRLRKLTIPTLYKKPCLEMSLLDKLVFCTELRSLRIFPIPVMTQQEESQEEVLLVLPISVLGSDFVSTAAASGPAKLRNSTLVRLSTTYVPASWFAAGARFLRLRSLSVRAFGVERDAINVTLDSLLIMCPALECLRIAGANVIADKARFTRDCRLVEFSMSYCGMAIEHLESSLSHLPRLRVLRLESMSNHAILSGIASAAFAGHLQVLRELKFTFRALFGEEEPMSHVTMQQVMDCVSQLPALTSLTLPDNSQDDEFEQAITEAVDKLNRGLEVYFDAQ
jgi:hypothetical protein